MKLAEIVAWWVFTMAYHSIELSIFRFANNSINKAIYVQHKIDSKLENYGFKFS